MAPRIPIWCKIDSGFTGKGSGLKILGRASVFTFYGTGSESQMKVKAVEE